MIKHLIKWRFIGLVFMCFICNSGAAQSDALLDAILTPYEIRKDKVLATFERVGNDKKENERAIKLINRIYEREDLEALERFVDTAHAAYSVNTFIAKWAHKKLDERERQYRIAYYKNKHQYLFAKDEEDFERQKGVVANRLALIMHRRYLEKPDLLEEDLPYRGAWYEYLKVKKKVPTKQQLNSFRCKIRKGEIQYSEAIYSEVTAKVEGDTIDTEVKGDSSIHSSEQENDESNENNKKEYQFKNWGWRIILLLGLAVLFYFIFFWSKESNLQNQLLAYFNIILRSLNINSMAIDKFNKNNDLKNLRNEPSRELLNLKNKNADLDRKLNNLDNKFEGLTTRVNNALQGVKKISVSEEIERHKDSILGKLKKGIEKIIKDYLNVHPQKTTSLDVKKIKPEIRQIANELIQENTFKREEALDIKALKEELRKEILAELEQKVAADRNKQIEQEAQLKKEVKKEIINKLSSQFVELSRLAAKVEDIEASIEKRVKDLVENQLITSTTSVVSNDQLTTIKSELDLSIATIRDEISALSKQIKEKVTKEELDHHIQNQEDHINTITETTNGKIKLLESSIPQVEQYVSIKTLEESKHELTKQIDEQKDKIENELKAEQEKIKGEIKEKLLQEYTSSSKLAEDQTKLEEQLRKKVEATNEELNTQLSIIADQVANQERKINDHVTEAKLKKIKAEINQDTDKIKEAIADLESKLNQHLSTLSDVSGTSKKAEKREKTAAQPETEQKREITFAVNTPLRSDVSPRGVKKYAERPQGGLFVHLYDKLKPQTTFFVIIQDVNNPLEGFLDLVEDRETIDYLQRYPDALREVADTSGDADHATRFKVHPGSVVKDGEFWKIKQKMRIDWM